MVQSCLLFMPHGLQDGPATLSERGGLIRHYPVLLSADQADFFVFAEQFHIVYRKVGIFDRTHQKALL